MQHKKQPAALRNCRKCGTEVRGKYAIKQHICRPEAVAAYSREQAMAAQRKERANG